MPSISIQFDLADDRESFSVKFFSSNPGSLRLIFTTWLRGAETVENLEFGEKKGNLYPGVLPYKKHEGAHHTFRDGQLEK